MKKFSLVLVLTILLGVFSACGGRKGAEDYYKWAEKTILETEYKDKNTTPYGNFESYTYYSTVTERDTKMNVLLPPNYNEDKEYPVLYILHGFWDNEDWMARDIVKIPHMLTELYEEGKAKEMIVVCPYIFTSKQLAWCTGMDLMNSLAYDNFINALVKDVMPFVEETFSVKKGRDNTAITGFSMGGRESLFIGFTRPDLFSYVGSICAAPGVVPVSGSAMHPGQMQERELSEKKGNEFRLVYISGGQYDGVVGDYPKTYHEILDRNNVKHVFEMIDGAGHDHTSVTPHLYKFFQVIFK